MKKIFLITCMLLCAALNGWGQEENGTQEIPTITFYEDGNRTTHLTFAADEVDVEKYVTVTGADDRWEIDFDKEKYKWLSITKDKEDMYKIIIKMTMRNSSGSRTVTVFVKDGNGKKSPLNITQDYRQISFNTNYPTKLMFNSKKDSIVLPLTSDANWSCDYENPDDKKWVTIEPDNGNSGHNKPIVVSVKENINTGTRKATIIFRTNNKEKQHTLIVTQIAKDIIRANNELTYDGNNKDLITPSGDTEGCIVTYSLASDEEYTNNIPTAKDAGTHTVYYKVIYQGDTIDVDSIPVLINTMEVSLTWDNTTFTYDGKPHKPTATVANRVVGDECVVITEVTAQDGSSLTEAVNAGSYTVMATELSNNNYTLPTSEESLKQDFTINKKVLKADVTAKNKTYDGNADAEVSATVETGIEGETLTISLTGKFENADAGEGKVVIFDYSLAEVSAGENTNADNYIVNYPQESLKANIKAKVVNADGTETATGKIELSESLFTYNGYSKEPPTVTVRDKNGNVVPRNQYEVTYKDSNNNKVEDIKDAGTYTVEITPKNGANYKVSGTATFWIVWLDNPNWKDEFNKAVKDKQNVNNREGKVMSEGIRSGNTLILPSDSLKPKMNYEPEEYEWKYTWKLDNNIITDNNIVIKNEGKMKLTCEAILKRGDEQVYSLIIYEETITVYPKPDVCSISRFEQKGNGNSGTYIIIGIPDSIDVIVAVYDEGGKTVKKPKKITSEELKQKWFKMEDLNDEEKPNLCIYVERPYENDKVKITSDIRMVTIGNSSCQPVTWDGSTYESTYTANTAADITRSEDETTEVESVDGSLNSGVSEVYTINGAKTATMTRGLNIIRMEDGTVRKVFKK